MGLVALFRTPEYRNLPTLADAVGKRGYIDHCTAARVNDKDEVTAELSGPGSALTKLDQALHRAIGMGAALTTWLATRPRARR